MPFVFFCNPQIRDLTRGDYDTAVHDDTAGDVLGPAFADSRLPNGTLAMLSHLRRARDYRRRADRQQECLENEVRYCWCIYAYCCAWMVVLRWCW